MQAETLANLEKEMEKDKGYQFQFNKQRIFQEYYKEAFPFNKIFKWLCYDQVNRAENKALGKGGDYFNRREISYMVVSQDKKEEFCIRHDCYQGPQEFRKTVQRLNPIRIDVGPVCDIIPSKAKDNSIKRKPFAVEREFIIDIDMDDYDEIRTCCKGKKICESCWKYLTAAYEVLKGALETDFGFKHIMWIFSGRRGIHAWVCDERARIMEDTVRKGVTHYLNISIGNDKSDTLIIPGVHSNPYYPLFDRSFTLLETKFEEFIVGEQAFFIYERNIEKVMSVLERLAKFNSQAKGYVAQVQELKKKLLKKASEELPDLNQNVSRSPTGPNSAKQSEVSQTIFDTIKKFFETNREFSSVEPKFMREIVLGLMYPKIDFNVSATTNHLLKCPFNIHSGTGLLSVPIDFETFDFTEVPYAQDVIEHKRKNNAVHPNFKEYLDFFDKFCDGLVQSEIKLKKHIQRTKMDEEELGTTAIDF